MTEQLTNATVKAAIKALQKGYRHAWSACLSRTRGCSMMADHAGLDEFTKEALGRERFTSIEEVPSGGPNVVGPFHSDRWGDYRTDFDFRLPSGKTVRLDIGQAT